jgi:DNA anti-recombination protein RmuC
MVIIALGGCRSDGNDEKASPSKAIERDESMASQPRSAPGRAARDFVETRDRVLAEMNAKLADLEAKIASLKNELATRSAERKREANEELAGRIAALEQKRAEAREALRKGRDATEEQWKQLESKTEETLDGIRDAYEETIRELRK